MPVTNISSATPIRNQASSWIPSCGSFSNRLSGRCQIFNQNCLMLAGTALLAAGAFAAFVAEAHLVGGALILLTLYSGRSIYQANRNSSTSELNNLRVRNQQLEEAQRNTQATLDQVNRQYADSQAANQRMNQTIASVQEQFSDLQRRHSALESEQGQLRCLVENLQRDNQRLQEQVADFDHDISMLNQEIGEVNDQNLTYANNTLQLSIDPISLASRTPPTGFHVQTSAELSERIQIAGTLAVAITNAFAKQNKKSTDEISDLNNEILTLRTNIEALRGSDALIDVKAARLEKLNNDFSETQKLLTEYGDKLQSTAIQLDDNNQAIASLDLLIKDKTDQLTALKENFNETQSKLQAEEQALKGECARLEVQKQNLEADMEKLNTDLTTTKNQLEKVCTEYDAMVESLKESSDELIGKKRDQQSLEEQNAELELALRKQNAQLDDALAKQGILTNELSTLAVFIQTHEKELVTLNSNKDTLTKELESLAETIETRQKELLFLNTEKNILTKELSTLAELIQTNTEALKNLSANKEALEEKLPQLKQDVQAATERLSTLQSEEEANTKRLASLKEEIQQEEAKFQKLQSEKATVEKELTSLKQQNEDESKKLQGVRSDIQATNARLEALMKNLKQTEVGLNHALLTAEKALQERLDSVNKDILGKLALFNQTQVTPKTPEPSNSLDNDPLGPVAPLEGSSSSLNFSELDLSAIFNDVVSTTFTPVKKQVQKQVARISKELTPIKDQVAEINSTLTPIKDRIAAFKEKIVSPTNLSAQFDAAAVSPVSPNSRLIRRSVSDLSSFFEGKKDLTRSHDGKSNSSNTSQQRPRTFSINLSPKPKLGSNSTS